VAFLELVAARGDIDNKMGPFIEAHPEALPAIEATMLAPIPASYAQLGYHGIHTFFYENGAGERRPVRHEWVPEAGEAVLEGDDPDRVADHLQQECRGRLDQDAIVFTLRLHLGTDEDDPDDPTVRWPDERETVAAGRLEITAVADDQDAADRLIFDPTNVPDGVECSDDRILHARSRAYGVSYERRLAGR
jgi:catalase